MHGNAYSLSKQLIKYALYLYQQWNKRFLCVWPVCSGSIIAYTCHTPNTPYTAPYSNLLKACRSAQNGRFQFWKRLSCTISATTTAESTAKLWDCFSELPRRRLRARLADALFAVVKLMAGGRLIRCHLWPPHHEARRRNLIIHDPAARARVPAAKVMPHVSQSSRAHRWSSPSIILNWSLGFAAAADAEAAVAKRRRRWPPLLIGDELTATAGRMQGPRRRRTAAGLSSFRAHLILSSLKRRQ